MTKFFFVCFSTIIIILMSIIRLADMMSMINYSYCLIVHFHKQMRIVVVVVEDFAAAVVIVVVVVVDDRIVASLDWL